MKHGPHCGCHACSQQIIYPTKHNKVDTFSENVVEHIHPSHTSVVNHHLIKNKHLYPHSTSHHNTCNSVDMHSPPFPAPSPGQVGGAMTPPPAPGPNQVAGAMNPCCGPGHGPHQVGGAMQPGHGHWKPPHGGMMQGYHGHGPHQHGGKHFDHHNKHADWKKRY